MVYSCSPNSPQFYGKLTLIGAGATATFAVVLFLTIHSNHLPTALMAIGSASLLAISYMLSQVKTKAKSEPDENVDPPPPDETAKKKERPPTPDATQKPLVLIPSIFASSVPMSQINVPPVPIPPMPLSSGGEESKSFTECYTMRSAPKIPTEAPRNGNKTQFLVVSNDSLTEAIHILKTTGVKPLVLNMTSGLEKGGGGYEEHSLLARTDLALSLDEADRNKGYPFSETGGIYSGNVHVFCRKATHAIDVISMAPYCLKMAPPGHKGEIRNDFQRLGHNGCNMTYVLEANTRYADGTRKKIANILRMAYKHGHKHLVLGALGCGDFDNPPDLIAKFFKQVLNRPEFRNIFDSVTFAVPHHYEDNPPNSPDGYSLTLFNNQFKGSISSPRRPHF